MHALLTLLPEASDSEAESERDRVDSIPALRAVREANTASWRAFQESTEALAAYSTAALIARIETTRDPLMLWEIHQELDRRDIPPAFRYPKNHDNGQMRFVTWLADLHWHTKRARHGPRFRTWRRLFAPVGESWHESAKNVFEYGWRRCQNASYYAKGLALTDDDRLDLMTIKTSKQIARQRQLKQSEEMRRAISSHAIANAGRLSKERRPEQTARDRYLIWKTYMLADQSPTITARMFEAIYGEQMTRQKVQKQIATVNQAWDKFGPKKGEELPTPEV
jgi:hypothetical protein